MVGRKRRWTSKRTPRPLHRMMDRIGPHPLPAKTRLQIRPTKEIMLASFLQLNRSPTRGPVLATFFMGLQRAPPSILALPVPTNRATPLTGRHSRLPWEAASPTVLKENNLDLTVTSPVEKLQRVEVPQSPSTCIPLTKQATEINKQVITNRIKKRRKRMSFTKTGSQLAMNNSDLHLETIEYNPTIQNLRSDNVIPVAIWNSSFPETLSALSSRLRRDPVITAVLARNPTV